LSTILSDRLKLEFFASAQNMSVGRLSVTVLLCCVPTLRSEAPVIAAGCPVLRANASE